MAIEDPTWGWNLVAQTTNASDNAAASPSSPTTPIDYTPITCEPCERTGKECSGHRPCEQCITARGIEECVAHTGYWDRPLCQRCNRKDQDTRWRQGPDGHQMLCDSCGTQRLCHSCDLPEKSNNYKRGPFAQGTLCHACGQQYKRAEVRLQNENQNCEDCGGVKTLAWTRIPAGLCLLCIACKEEHAILGRNRLAFRRRKAAPSSGRRSRRPTETSESSHSMSGTGDTGQHSSLAATPTLFDPASHQHAQGDIFNPTPAFNDQQSGLNSFGNEPPMPARIIHDYGPGFTHATQLLSKILALWRMKIFLYGVDLRNSSNSDNLEEAGMTLDGLKNDLTRYRMWDQRFEDDLPMEHWHPLPQKSLDLLGRLDRHIGSTFGDIPWDGVAALRRMAGDVEYDLNFVVKLGRAVYLR